MNRVIERPRAIVDTTPQGEFVVVLIKPRGERVFYVATGVDNETNTLYPFVSETIDRAKKFGVERNAWKVAQDMSSFLAREYQNLVKWA